MIDLPIGVPAQLAEVHEPGVGSLDRPAHAERNGSFRPWRPLRSGVALSRADDVVKAL